jgi:hypothetical protein
MPGTDLRAAERDGPASGLPSNPSARPTAHGLQMLKVRASAQG